MNKYHFISVACILVGTLLLMTKGEVLSIEHILGAFINSFALLFSFYGSKLLREKENRESNRQLNEKFEELKDEIDKVRLIENEDEKANKLIEIKNDFANWANAFHKDINIKRLSIEEKNLDIQKRQLENNKVYRKNFVSFLSNLEQMILAYNEKTKKTLKYDIPEFPANIYSQLAHEYKAKIFFEDNNCWLIYNSKFPFQKFSVNIPNINILRTYPEYDERVKESKLGLPTGFLCITFYVDHFSGILNEKDYDMQNFSYDYNDFDKMFKKIIVKIFEEEIIKLSEEEN